MKLHGQGNQNLNKKSITCQVKQCKVFQTCQIPTKYEANMRGNTQLNNKQKGKHVTWVWQTSCKLTKPVLKST